MVFWLCTKILEYRLLPVPLHVVPVLNLTMANGVVDAIARGLSIGNSLISNEEVKIFYPSFGSEVARFGGYCRPWTT